jgi:choline-sulfatase
MRIPAGVSRSEFFNRLCPPLPDNFEVPQGEPPGVRQSDWRPFRAYVQAHWTAEQWRLHRWAYARLTERVDAEIGTVLQALRDAGLEDRTVVVFTSDHGDMDASHRMEHKSMPYEEAIHVPLIVSWKGVTPGGAVDRTHLVSTGLDLIPTLCDFAGISSPLELKGRSVKPLAVSDAARAQWRDVLVVENEGCRVVRSERYKYAVYGAGEPREFLLDEQADPGEMRNLAGDPAHRQVLEQHRALLKRWYQEHGESLDAKYVVSSEATKAP